MSLMKKVIKKIDSIYFKYLSPHAKAEYLRGKVYHMGNNVQIFTTGIGTEPYLLSIGDNVNIAARVLFLNHDISVFNMTRFLDLENPLDKVAPIILKDNCMIGAQSILMSGAVVGKNSIVAAGSIVTKQIPDSEVWGGYQPSIL